MRPSQILRGGGGSEFGKHGVYTGPMGASGSSTQKGIFTYALSANRQRPLAGMVSKGIFNTWRRFSAQVLYVAPPLVFAYLTMSWAVDRNHYLNSKEGRLEFGDEEE